MRELSFFYKLDDIGNAAAQLIAAAGNKKVWLFTGDMGAGKTTLIKAICSALGAKGDFSSPTYSLVNEYDLANNNDKIYHLDLYRLKNINEALDIGIEEYLYSGGYCLIEWPQLIMPLLNEGEYLPINISSISEIERKITIFI
jgi:tRNA threonylcarbamoyladenosine biosynthesis protein TsaE